MYDLSKERLLLRGRELVMKIVTYDCEVFSHDWIVVFKDKETGIFTVVHNDNEALRSCISEDAIYIGFNSKHYDQYIVKGICADFSPQELKQLNDYIITGNQGWQYPLLNGFYFSFNNVDIRDDTQQGLSLKAIEGHQGVQLTGRHGEVGCDGLYIVQ